MIEMGIYKITNLINGKLYIGSTNNFKVRFSGHRSRLNRDCHYNLHLQSSYNKYGKNNFTMEILEHCDENALLEREQYYVDELKVLNPKKGYNKASDIRRTSGNKWSDESKKRLSDAKKGMKMHPNTKKALIKANKERVYGDLSHLWTKEAIEKAALSRSNPVLQYDLDGNFVKEWDHAILARKNYSSKEGGNITGCCNGIRDKAYEYQWRWKTEDYELKIKPYKRNAISSSILCYNVKGEFVESFESIADAKRKMKLKTSGGINDCLSNKRQMCKGFQWYYKPENNIYPEKVLSYVRGKSKGNIDYFIELCLNMV